VLTLLVTCFVFWYRQMFLAACTDKNEKLEEHQWVALVLEKAESWSDSQQGKHMTGAQSICLHNEACSFHRLTP
jgi:hypothetical protein